MQNICFDSLNSILIIVENCGQPEKGSQRPNVSIKINHCQINVTQFSAFSLRFLPLKKAVLPEDVHNEILEVIVAETLQEMANESKHFIQYYDSLFRFRAANPTFLSRFSTVPRFCFCLLYSYDNVLLKNELFKYKKAIKKQ